MQILLGSLKWPHFVLLLVVSKIENPEKSYRRDDNEIFFRQMKKNLKKKIKLNKFGQI